MESTKNQRIIELLLLGFGSNELALEEFQELLGNHDDMEMIDTLRQAVKHVNIIALAYAEQNDITLRYFAKTSLDDAKELNGRWHRCDE